MSRDSKKAPKIKLIDLTFHEVLYEFTLDQEDEAYAMAKELEAAGVNFELRFPPIAESLAESLGASEEEKEKLKQDLDDEIDEHN